MDTGPTGHHAATQTEARLRPEQHALVQPLRWWAVPFWVVFRPVRFFGAEIDRVPFAGTVVMSVLWPALVVTIAMAGSATDAGTDFSNSYIASIFLLASLMLWLGSFGGVCLAGLLLAPAISGARKFGEALYNALRLAACVAAVTPVATLIIVLFALHIEELADVVQVLLGHRFDEEVVVGLFALPSLWPVVLLFLGLFLDGKGRAMESRPCGEVRCERCGYDLRVLPPEDVCPECGLAASISLDATRRVTPLAEREGRRFADVLRTAWSAFWRPATFWRSARVRCDSRKARNGFLALTLLAAALGLTMFLLALGGLKVCLPGSDLDDLLAQAESGVLYACGLGVVVLLLNHVVLLLGIACARLRGNELAHDELARVGYFALSLPAAVEVGLGFCALTFAVTAFEVQDHFYRHGLYAAGSRLGELIYVALKAGELCLLLVFLAVLAGSGASMLRAMEVTRYANH